MQATVTVKIEPFDCKLTSNTYSRWKSWFKHFEGLVKLNGYSAECNILPNITCVNRISNTLCVLSITLLYRIMNEIKINKIRT